MKVPPRVPAVVLGDLTLVRPLVSAGVPVVVATTDPHDPTLASRHAREALLLPGLDGPDADRSFAILQAFGERTIRTVGTRPPLFYGSDESLRFLYDRREDLERCFTLLFNERSTADALLYKDAFARLAERRGVRVPRAFAASDPRLGGVDRPVIVKPKSKVDWHELETSILGASNKARVFPTGRALLDHPAFDRCKGDLIVQEHVAGAEQDLFSFHGFADRDGELLASFCGRKIRAFPKTTGESSFIELVNDEALARHGASVAAALGLRGVFKIDLVLEADTGSLFTLEVNARFNLWHHLGAADGINLPAVAYDYLVSGTRPPRLELTPQHRFISLYRDYKSYRQRNELGELDFFSWLRSLAGKPAVFEAFAWDDPAPALSWFGGVVHGKLARWLSTGS